MKKYLVTLLILTMNVFAEECSQVLIKPLLEEVKTIYRHQLISSWFCATSSRGEIYSKAGTYLREIGRGELACSGTPLAINEVLGLVDLEIKEKFYQCQKDKINCGIDEDFSGFLTFKAVNNTQNPIPILSIDLGKLNFIDETDFPKEISPGINEWILLNENQVPEQKIMMKTSLGSCEVHYRVPPINPNNQKIKKCASVYEHIHFEGRFLNLYDGFDPKFTLKTHFLNNLISSAKVEPGCTLTLYEHDAFNGPQIKLKNSHDNFVVLERERFQDRISSLECSCE